MCPRLHLLVLLYDHSPWVLWIIEIICSMGPPSVDNEKLSIPSVTITDTFVSPDSLTPFTFNRPVSSDIVVSNVLVMPKKLPVNAIAVPERMERKIRRGEVPSARIKDCTSLLLSSRLD
jgi:hypothetical protein